MQSLTIHPATEREARPDPAFEAGRLEALLAERRAELNALQGEMRAFRARYTEVVGSRLAELAETEEAIRGAEKRRIGHACGEEEEETAPVDLYGGPEPPAKLGVRRLFWSVAKLFHPDHAADEQEARRRHTIMAEASRAYREGDVESLHTLLADEELQSYCATARGKDEEVDLAARVINLKEELRTIEFGLKRIRQDRLYRLKLSADEAAREGRDALAEEAARVARLIAKARRRLEHMS